MDVAFVISCFYVSFIRLQVGSSSVEFNLLFGNEAMMLSTVGAVILSGDF